MNPPGLSIAILTYNRCQYLRQAIAAALAQSYPNFELLVVDNASEDDTAKMMCGVRDPRVIYVRRSVNGGPLVNNAEAIARASSPLLLITHDDDLMHPEMAERQMQAFQDHPEAVLVASNVQPIDPGGNVLESSLYPIDGDRVFQKGELLKVWLSEGFWLPTPTCMLRLRKEGGRQHLGIQWADPRKEAANPYGITGDMLSTCRMNRFGSVVYLADPLLSYRVHSSQSTFRDDPVTPQVPFFHAILDLCHSSAATKSCIPEVEAGLLRYQAQELALKSGGSCEIETLQKGLLKLESQTLRKRRVAGNPDSYTQFALLMHLSGGQCRLLPSPPESWLRESVQGAEGGFRRWFASIMGGRPLSMPLHDQGIRSVAIMGSLLNGVTLALDCQASGIRVTGFLDSNTWRAGRTLLGLPIHPTERVAEVLTESDLLLFSSEHKSESSLKNFLRAYLADPDLARCLSWQRVLEEQN